jgi:hypothetical protein
MTNLEASIKAIAMSFATAILSEIRKVPLTELQSLATPAPAKVSKVKAPKAKVKAAPKPKAVKVKAPAKVVTFEEFREQVKAARYVPAPPAPKPVSNPAASKPAATQATNGTVFIRNRVGGGFTATFGGKTYNATRSRDLAYKAKKAGFSVTVYPN